MKRELAWLWMGSAFVGQLVLSLGFSISMKMFFPRLAGIGFQLEWFDYWTLLPALG